MWLSDTSVFGASLYHRTSAVDMRSSRHSNSGDIAMSSGDRLGLGLADLESPDMPEIDDGYGILARVHHNRSLGGDSSYASQSSRSVSPMMPSSSSPLSAISSPDLPRRQFSSLSPVKQTASSQYGQQSSNHQRGSSRHRRQQPKQQHTMSGMSGRSRSCSVSTVESQDAEFEFRDTVIRLKEHTHIVSVDAHARLAAVSS